MLGNARSRGRSALVGVCHGTGLVRKPLCVFSRSSRLLVTLNMACIRRRYCGSGFFGPLVFVVLLNHVLVRGTHQGETIHSEEVSWEFEDDTNGWGNSTSEELHIELHPRGGELRGRIRGPYPHMDSPTFVINANNLADQVDARHYCVFRMSYRGSCKTGRLYTRLGGDRFPYDGQMDVTEHRAWSTPVSYLNQGSANQLHVDQTSFLVDYEVFNDGGWHNYYVPLWKTYKGLITQLRLHPVVPDSKHGVEKSGYRCHESSSVRADQSAVLISNTAIPTKEECALLCEKVNSCVAALHNNAQCMTYSRCQDIPPANASTAKGTLIVFSYREVPNVGETFAIDFIKIAKAPTIMTVEGCINKRYVNSTTNPARVYGAHNTTVETHVVHTHNGKPSLTYIQTKDVQHSPLWYGKTYNCLRSGGELIKITGRNFGVFDPSWSEATPTVTIGGKPCTHVKMTIPERQLTCISPPGIGDDVPVTVTNGKLPGLSGTQQYFSYARAPPECPKPSVSNVAAKSFDISWLPPVDYWDALTVTGYSIKVERLVHPTTGRLGRTHFVTVGNVSKTTLVGLESDSIYRVAVSGLTEDQDVTACNPEYADKHCRSAGSTAGTRTGRQWQQLDLYGRRPPVTGALFGAYSPWTDIVWTRNLDFRFDGFDANSTLLPQTGGAVDNRTIEGPTGNHHGEGHYGINLVGDANLQNCNSSFACCDGFQSSEVDYEKGTRSTLGCTLVCSAIGTAKIPETYIANFPNRNVTTNALSDGIVIGTVADLSSHNATAQCGGALRLTPSFARKSGAAWYPRVMNVREGFDTTFKFRISNPSMVCQTMDDVYTNCRSRGADGFAFVIQNFDSLALGKAGMEMGYGGIMNSLAVEFDTFYNAEFYDPFENHVSVNSRGFRYRNSGNHTYEFGSTTAVPDLSDGEHFARIRYTPTFDEDLLFSADNAFIPDAPHVVEFLENADWKNGGQGDWSTGMGSLAVYVDDLKAPILTVPMNLADTLELQSGRAYVGFTAATGENMWQVHDILEWEFTSLREDPPYYPPIIVNEEGAHQCNSDDCVHF